ncbi:MAG TPA: hypothetical protein VEU62_07825, partial [Bryobacterales bacterium]|nr:hypothetical protein [Bryobacterales bacterium]
QASAAMSWSFDPSPGGHTPMTFTDTSPVGAGSYGLMFNVSNNATAANTSIAPPTINLSGQGWASGPAASQRLLYQVQLQPQTGTSQVGGFLAFNAQANAGGDIGAPPTVARLFPNGALEATQFEAAKSTPIAAVQSGAGTGGSCTTEVNLGSSDMSGRLYLTTGASGWAAGTQCILTFANGLSGWATLTPANAVTAAAMSSRQVYVGGGGVGSNQFTVNFGLADIASTAYSFNWHAIGNY